MEKLKIKVKETEELNDNQEKKRLNGMVKWFNVTKGYGFIKEDDNDTEHFVHVSGLIDRITEGDKVEFELKEGNKGLNAINVKVI